MIKKYDYLVHAENLINSLNYAGWRTKILSQLGKDDCYVIAKKANESILINIPKIPHEVSLHDLKRMCKQYKTTPYVYHYKTGKIFEQML